MPSVRWRSRSVAALALLGAAVAVEQVAPAGAPTSTPAAPRCPEVERPSEGTAPWDVWARFERCIRGPEGRWLVERDATDADGWRHVLVFAGAAGRGWRLPLTSPTGMARRVDGHVVVLDLKEGVTLVTPGGKVAWRSSHPYCGAVRNVAIGWDDAITFTCGYSVLRLDAGGKLLWQKWPFGDKHVRGPWVDRSGTLYVSGAGKVAALGPDGERRWTVDAGFNRAISDLAWSPAGNLVFDTSMDELHSPTSPSGVRFYFDHEPMELFEVTRAGVIVRRTKHETPTPEGGWPAVLPLPEDGAHRVPFE